MSKYGQYCPVAKSLEILGDRWTLLIIRDLLYGTRHFNDLERGLPGTTPPRHSFGPPSACCCVMPPPPQACRFDHFIETHC